MSVNDVTLAFLDTHAIKVLNSNKRAHKQRRMNVDYFAFPEDYNMFQQQATHVLETEPLLTIEIAQSELERIAAFESQVFNNMKETGHYNMFETIMEQKQKERELRETYPAVKKIYEQYSMMLSLAKSGKI